MTTKEKAAIFHVCSYMCSADSGRQIDTKSLSFFKMMEHISPIVGNDDIIPILEMSNDMTDKEASAVVKGLPDDIRLVVRNTILQIAFADNEVTEEEKSRYLCLAITCNLPPLPKKNDEKEVSTNKNEENNDSQFLDEDGEISVDGISYILYEDGTASVNFLEEDEDREEVIIPSQIVYKGKKYPVTCFNLDDGEYSRLVLPSTIKSVCGFSFMDREHLNNLKVEMPKNENIVLVDGVFYSKDMKNLQCAALLKECKTYTILSGVEHIWNSAFETHDEIEVLNIPNTVKQIDAPFSSESRLRIVNIYNTEGSVKFYDEEPGVESFSSNVTINYLPEHNILSPEKGNVAVTAEKQAKAVYRFGGKEYKKKTDLVQTVVHQYIEEHDVTTIEELKQVFDIRVKQGVPMLLSLEDAMKTKDSAGKAGGNFAVGEDMQIALKKKGFLGIKMGVKVVVWNYWPEKYFNNFLDLCQRLGQKVDVVQ